MKFVPPGFQLLAVRFRKRDRFVPAHSTPFPTMYERKDPRPTHKLIRFPGRWARIPRMERYEGPTEEYQGETVFTGGTYDRGEYRVVSHRRTVPDGATVCFVHKTPNICDIDWRVQHRKGEDRRALQCISYCLTRRITPREYYEMDQLHPYQQGDDNVSGVPAVVDEAWHQLPAGLRSIAKKPAIRIDA